nr:hypothetical protein Iba_chr08dCG1880 [Ipomoea batatas]
MGRDLSTRLLKSLVLQNFSCRIPRFWSMAMVKTSPQLASCLRRSRCGGYISINLQRRIWLWQWLQ